MKKYILFLLLIAVVLVSGCVGYGNQPQPNANRPPSGTNAVTIKDFAFSPSTLTIKAGTAVTWTTLDSAPHQIASDPHPAHTDLPGLISGTLEEGQSYSFAFDRAGTFGYHCHLHPNMKGTIIVEQ